MPNYGPTTNGNAKAAKAVKGVPLTGTAGSGLTRGVTSSSVKVGCYLQQASFAGADAGLQGPVPAAANSTKELPGGRTIDFQACQDDGSNPQTNLQIVQKLVQQDQVFAVVGISADVLPASTDFMNTNQVPVLRLGFPARLLPHPLGLRLRRLPDHGDHRQPEGVPGQPGARADRGRRPQGPERQGQCRAPDR